MTDTRRITQGVADKMQTRDPFSIAESLGFIVLYAPLVGVRGFYQRIKRNHFIYIDPRLDERQRKLVCAHELGHWFLHRKINRIFMDTYTHFRSARYENEANRFAVFLLFSDEELEEIAQYPVEQIACRMGVPPDLAEYRMRGLQTRLC